MAADKMQAEKDKRLFDALESSRWGGLSAAEADKALAGGANANAKSRSKIHGEGARPLHLAAKGADAAMVKKLLALGADPNAARKDGSRPLHAALWNKGCGVEVAQALVDGGADIEALDSRGRSPLGAALRRDGGFAVASLLLSLGASWDASAGADGRPEHEAMEWADEAALDFMLANGADVLALDKAGRSLPRALAERGRWGWSASKESEEAAVRMAAKLAAAGCPFDVPSGPAGFKEHLVAAGLRAGAPALLLAKLVELGAPVGPPDEVGVRGAGAVAEMNDPKRLAIALGLGLDPNWTALSGHTLLDLAIDPSRASCAECVGLLLEAGADPNAPGSAGRVPLHVALARGGQHAQEVLGVLLDHGADPNKPSGRFKASPLAVACCEGVSEDALGEGRTCSLEALSLLLSRGGNPNAPFASPRGERKPMLAAARQWMRKALIDGGADADVLAARLASGAAQPQEFELGQVKMWIDLGASPAKLAAAIEKADWAGKGGSSSIGATLAWLQSLEVKASAAPGADAEHARRPRL